MTTYENTDARQIKVGDVILCNLKPMTVIEIDVPLNDGDGEIGVFFLSDKGGAKVEVPFSNSAGVTLIY